MKKLLAVAVCLLAAHLIVSVFHMHGFHSMLAYGIGLIAGLAV
jgi:hypothetical protein